ncbi:ABC-type transporter, permease subunit [Candidatus Protochlamydia naegleriophila]|uniref:ABC-type transporter, permease subunit n=1 Tax=Candidatus Protochlamydia naegleriophila TaxID=389348 RepID=A0A0U5K328_9BACT|nr:hypothetical protein [Candidatus Protochlamydia naegleriophila]CUI16507.1 ABC-type transporter, permease subunit [Candidatus Protochlamydia naegleriophila]
MTSILEQMLLVLPLLIGAYLSLSLMKVPDLSLESAYLFGATLGLTCQSLPLPIGIKIPLVIIAAIAGGMSVGLVASCLNQYFCLPFLLGAIMTNGLFHGLTLLILGQSVKSFDPGFNLLALLPFGFSHQELGMLMAINLFIVLIVGIILSSQLGVSFAIFGNNSQFFKHHGLSTKYIVIAGICLADGCAGLGGYLFAQSNGFVDLTMGYGIILLCLTSLILGKMLVQSSYPTLAIPCIGLLCYFVIQQFLLNVGLNLKYFNAFQALLIMAALMTYYYQKSPLNRLDIDHLGV